MFKLFHCFSSSSLISFAIVAILLGAFYRQFGVYDDVTPFVEHLEQAQRTVMLVVIVILASLYLVFFYIIKRANDIILRQDEELKQSEILIAQAQDAALAGSQLKSEILAKVSHELRTPLGAILGFAQLLEMGSYGPLSKAHRKATIEIIDSANFLNNLVDELLAQAKLDAGKLALNLSPFLPVEIVNNVYSQMNILAEKKGLLLRTNIGQNLPYILYGDSAHLQQILINLVGNAIKFTDSGTIQIKLFCLGTTHWAIQVIDTGPGIPGEAQSRIFEPFGQVDGSVTRTHGGTGLGLSIVKQLAYLMGGQITLKSELGQGSTFTIFLPLNTPLEKLNDECLSLDHRRRPETGHYFRPDLTDG